MPPNERGRPRDGAPSHGNSNDLTCGDSTPLEAADARRITSRINILLDGIAGQMEKVLDLIEQAEAGQAHTALGYRSWPEYVAVEFKAAFGKLSALDRRPVVAKLSELGMSTRAIAPVVGVSQKTVDRDVRQVSHSDSPEKTVFSTASENVTGIDGKTYARRPEAAPRPRRRRPLPDAYWDAVYDLQKVVERLARLTEDDRFKTNVDRLREVHEADLQRSAEMLHSRVRMPLIGGAT